MRAGASAIELGLLLPLLLTITLGAIDLGRFGYSHLAVTNAARAGAGYASMQNYTATTKPSWDAQLRAAVEAEMASLIGGDGPFSSTDLVVTAVRTVESDGLRRVRVTAQFPFETVVSWPGIPEDLTLSHAVEIRGIR
ncbi:MAG: TadE/TadG family type IV pilus assembly protein [Planctomycetaceae bacterium]